MRAIDPDGEPCVANARVAPIAEAWRTACGELERMLCAVVAGDGAGDDLGPATGIAWAPQQ